MANTYEMNETLLARFIPMSGIQPEHLHELCPHAQFMHLQQGDTLRGDSSRTGIIHYVVDGTLRMSGGKAPSEIVTGNARNARYALLGLEDQHRQATADSACTLLLIDRVKVSNMLIFTQGTDALATGNKGVDAELASLLLESGLFSRIPPSNIERIGALIEPVQVTPNQMVIEQDSEGDFYYIIKQGHCEVLHKDHDGTQLHIATLGPGDSFGEEALITGSMRNASIRMRDAGVLLRLTRDYFIELISAPLLQAVSHQRAGELIANGAHWLDVRLVEEFQHDGLAQAESIPLAELRTRYRELDNDVSYITYCNSGRRAQAAAFLLCQRGISSSYLTHGIAQRRPQAQNADALRQELPELQAQLAGVDQELDEALRRKALAEAAQELGAQEFTQPLVKSDEDVRLMKLTVEAQKASELLDCAKEQKRSLEQLVRNAQAVTESRRRQAAAQCEHLRKHAQELLKEEKQRLEQCYESASVKLKALEQTRQKAELEFEAERQRLTAQFEQARLKMASEADKIRLEMEQATHDSEQHAERIRAQHSQREQQLRAETEAQLRDKRACLESEFALTIATQEKARQDLDRAEAARQSARHEAQRVQAQVKAQRAEQQQRERARQEQELTRLQALHDTAATRIKQARQRLEMVEAKKQTAALNAEVIDADKDLHAAEQAQSDAAKAQQQARDMVATTKTKEDELRLQLYEEMETWTKEEEKQSKTDVERALKYAAEMQRIQKEKQHKALKAKSETQDLFADLKSALDGTLETDPFGDYVHEQLVAEEKARLIKTARHLATANKQRAQQALSAIDPDQAQ